MKPAIVLSADDVRKIIAEKFDVDVKDVIRNQYTYTVITEEQKESK